MRALEGGIARAPRVEQPEPELSPSPALEQAAPLCISDLGGKLVYANGAYHALAGAGGRAERASLLPPREIVAGIIADGEPITRDLTLPGEPPRHFRCRHDGVYDDTGTLTGIATVFQDAASRTMLLRRLALTQERLEDVTRLVSDWIWEVGPDLTLTAVSPRVVALLGFHDRELVGRSFLGLGDFLDDDGAPTAAPLDGQRRAPFRDRLMRMNRRDGSPRLFRVSALPVFCPTSGEFTGFRGTARDVTDETEASERAAQSQRRLIEAIESISEGFALFDAEDHLILCNGKFRAMLPQTDIALGTTFEEVARRAVTAGDVRVPEGDFEGRLERRFALRRQPRAAIEMQLGDGRWMKVSDRKTAEGFTVGVRTDITELKRREEALVAAKEAAEIASRSKSEFLANISHELRTPLNAIIGFSEIMRDEIFGPIGNPQYRAYLTDVLDSAHHLLEVVNDILDVAKAEAGKLDIAEEEIDVAAVSRSALRLVQERGEKGQVRLLLDIPDTVPHVWADERKVKQVLLNLLTNSVKFTPPGGSVEISARVDIGGDLLIAVADSGIGIAEGDIAVALSPFGQVDGRLNRKYEGTGLGLPLSRALVELHGGRLTIESTVGEGTTVTVRFPASRVRPRSA